jgi:general secretion pathway protein N
MNRSVLRWWLLGAVAYLVFLGMTFPAQYLTDRLTRKLPELRLVGVEGSLFSGSAQQVNYAGSDLGAVDWHFDWLAPFSLSFGYRLHVHAEDRDLTGRLDMGFRHTYLRGLEGRIPVSALDRWSPAPPGSASGSLGVHLKELSFKAGAMDSAEGTLDLDEAVLKWPTSATLGSFHADLGPGSGGGIKAVIADTASPLKLQATLELGATGAYHLSGVLGPKDPSDQATRNLLAGLGRPDSTGQYPFDFKGQW